MTPPKHYGARAARSFEAFSAIAGGEKTLLWTHLRRWLSPTTEGRAPRVLDFGCGTGWLTRQVRDEFAVEALGYDPSKDMIAQALEGARGGADQGPFTASLAEAKARGPFDVVFLVFVTPALSSRAILNTTFQDAADLTAPRGRVLIAAANPETVFARHTHFESLRPQGTLRPGVAYRTKILAADGSALVTVKDYHWPAAALRAAAQGAGLQLGSDTRVADSQGDPAKLCYRLYEFAKR